MVATEDTTPSVFANEILNIVIVPTFKCGCVTDAVMSVMRAFIGSRGEYKQIAMKKNSKLILNPDGVSNLRFVVLRA